MGEPYTRIFTHKLESALFLQDRRLELYDRSLVAQFNTKEEGSAPKHTYGKDSAVGWSWRWIC